MMVQPGRYLSRWPLVLVAVAVAVAASVVAASVPMKAEPFMAGADISSLPIHEDHGAVYRDNNQVGDAIDILADHGTNWFRLRLFVNPQFQNNFNGGFDAFVAQDLDYTIALAQRVKQRGGKVFLDFHYSDTWADPGHQWKPEAWESLSFGQLEQQVYDYTRQSIEAFKAAGVLPEMVQIGNEIASGLLWDDGRLWLPSVPESQEFDNLATLLSAGIRGARDGAGPGDEPLIMIHHDQGSQWGTTSYYFDRLLPRLQANGTDVDVLGYSYYPIYHAGGIAGVQQNLTNSARTYGKQVVIAEAGFPSRNPTASEQNLGFPVTPAGQQAYLQALVDALENVPDGLGTGVFWWYAEARPTSGLSVWQNGRYGLFDQNGNLLPAADVYAALNPELPGDYNGDGFVDASDYTTWRDTLGQSVAMGSGADGNEDGTIGPEDYDVWVTNFGSSGAGSGVAAVGAAVPEPSTGSLVGWLILAGAVYCRFRR
jgi:arabinogalactan endo-1,4-beta-galactosidase